MASSLQWLKYFLWNDVVEINSVYTVWSILYIIFNFLWCHAKCISAPGYVSYDVPPLLFCIALQGSFMQLHIYFLLELWRTECWTLWLCLQNKHIQRPAIALPVLLSASFNLPPNFSVSTLEFLKFACLSLFSVQHFSLSSIIIRINCVLVYINNQRLTYYSRSQRPHGLRRGSATVRLLGLRVRIRPGA